MDDPTLHSRGAKTTIDAPTPRLIEHYVAIAAASRAMVAAARDDDWHEVSRLERECIRQVTRLKRAAQVQSLGPHEQRTRVHLLRSILADDAEIRRLAEPWLVELEQLLLPGQGSAPVAE